MRYVAPEDPHDQGWVQAGEFHDLGYVSATDIILPGQFGYPADFAR